MTTYCHVCAKPIKGAYSKENIPSGVTSHTVFIKCQSCSSDYPGITFADSAGRNPTRSSFENSFYECNGCGSLYFCSSKGIPFAYSGFSVEACPKCGQPLPTGAEIEFEPSDESRALQGGSPGSLEKMQPLYKTLSESVPKHPSLSKIVTSIMLVNTPRGHDIWVIYQAEFDFNTERAIVTQLRKLVDGIAFSGSQALEYALKDNMTIIEENKIKKRQSSSPKPVASKPEKKWWQFWK